MSTNEIDEKMQGNTCDKMISRLVEYRKWMAKTPKEMDALLQISENRYIEFEDGTKSIPGIVFIELAKAGWDVDYIISGTPKVERESLKECLKAYGSYNEKEIFRLLYWIFSNVITFDDSSREIHRELKLLQFLLLASGNSDEDIPTLVQIIRFMGNETQETWAKRLGICIKTFRKFESNIAKSNVKLLGDFCQRTGFRPSLFLNTSVEWQIIDRIWSSLNNDEKREVLDFMSKGIQMMNS